MVYIVDGPTQYEGRVEVYVDGVRGLVCDDSWDDVAASIVCKEMGFAGKYCCDPTSVLIIVVNMVKVYLG